jgi:carboxylate-amine ligase
VQRALVVENKWQAQRHGINAVFATEDGGISVADMLERTIEETATDAAELNCISEIGRCRAIVASGTSADAQLAVFDAHGAAKSREAALRAVTEWISVATLQ